MWVIPAKQDGDKPQLFNLVKSAVVVQSKEIKFFLTERKYFTFTSLISKLLSGGLLANVHNLLNPFDTKRYAQN